MPTFSSRTTAMRVASLITAANVLIAAGFSVAGLINPQSILPANYVPTEASFVFALYAAARKAHAELHWTPRFPGLDAIVRTAWEWHRVHPHGYEDR